MPRLLVVPDSERVDAWLQEQAQHAAFIDLTSICTLPQLLSRCEAGGTVASSLLVRLTLGKLAGTYAAPTFGRLAHGARFAAELETVITQLELNGVTPQQLEDAGRATRDEPTRARTRAVALAWRELEVRLHALKLVTPGSRWARAARAISERGVPPSLQAFDGLELHAIGHQPFTVLQCFEALAIAFGGRFRWQWPSSGADAVMSESLRFVEARWQHLHAEVVADELPPRGALGAFHAATPLAEAFEIARRAKEMMLAGVPPETMAVTAREAASLAPALARACRSLGVPLRVGSSRSLASFGPGQIALWVLSLADEGFPAEPLAALLESPFTSVLRAGAADPRATFRAVGLRDDRLGATATAGAYATRLEPVGADDAPGLRLLRESVATVIDSCARIPAQGPASVLFEAWWDALRTLGVLEAPRPTDADTLLGAAGVAVDRALARETMAVTRLVELLLALKASLELSGLGRQYLTRAELRAWLEAAAEDVLVADPTPRVSGLSLLELDQLAGRRFSQVFIAGLTDGRLPSRSSSSAIFSDDERLALNQAAKRQVFAVMAGEGDTRVPLSLAVDRWAFELATRAAPSITLSRARFDDAGAVLLPSPMLEALRQSPEALTETATRRAVIPSLEEAQTEEELQLRLALESLSPPATRQTVPDPDARAAAQRLSGEAWFAQAALHGAIETERLRFFSTPALPPGAYSGRIDGETLSELAQRLSFDPSRPLSAHELKEFGTCAFRGLSTMVLGLDTTDAGSEELDSRVRGTFWHEALARVVPALAERQLLGKPSPQLEELVREAVTAAAAALERKARTGHRSLWKLAQRWAITVITRVLSSPSALPFGLTHPRYVEVAFGSARAPDALREVRIPGVFSGERDVHLHGQIDRVDVGAGVLAVLDYKTSLPRTLGDDFLQSEFQMAFYLLAARALLDGVTPTGGWLNVSKNEVKSVLSVAGDSSLAEVLALDAPTRTRLQAEGKPNLANSVFSLLGRLRGGDFGARTRSCEHCSLKAVCRIGQRELVEEA